MNEHRGSRAPTTRVFVYGTLLRGESNHRLLARARWVGDGQTVPLYALYDLGAFPGLVARGSQSVVGEVYEVDQATLAALDLIEGHPEFYRRMALTLVDGSHVETYLLTPEQVQGRKVIRSGDWRARCQEQRA